MKFWTYRESFWSLVNGANTILYIDDVIEYTWQKGLITVDQM